MLFFAYLWAKCFDFLLVFWNFLLLWVWFLRWIIEMTRIYPNEICDLILHFYGVPSFFYFFIFFGPAILDVILSWKARQSMSFYVKLRYLLKLVAAAMWVIILPVTYAYSWKNPPGFAQTIRKWFGNSPSSSSLFILFVFIYLSPNMLSALLFLFPIIRRYLERSNNKIVMLMMWWSQVCIN